MRDAELRIFLYGPHLTNAVIQGEDNNEWFSYIALSLCLLLDNVCFKSKVP